MYQPITNEQLTAVASEFGSPVYVYHAEKITQQFQKLTDAFQGHATRFFYAYRDMPNRT